LIDFNGQEWIADMINNMLIEVLTTIAEQEVKKTDRRRAEGIAAMPVVDGKKVSLKTGRAYGRPAIECNDDFEKFLKKQKEGKISVVECCKQLGISRSTWYNRVSEVG
jgi:DNA invertase Pin-like site-specific DNA recombinase